MFHKESAAILQGDLMGARVEGGVGNAPPMRLSLVCSTCLGMVSLLALMIIGGCAAGGVTFDSSTLVWTTVTLISVATLAVLVGLANNEVLSPDKKIIPIPDCLRYALIIKTVLIAAAILTVAILTHYDKLLHAELGYGILGSMLIGHLPFIVSYFYKKMRH